MGRKRFSFVGDWSSCPGRSSLTVDIFCRVRKKSRAGLGRSGRPQPPLLSAQCCHRSRFQAPAFRSPSADRHAALVTVTLTLRTGENTASRGIVPTGSLFGLIPVSRHIPAPGANLGFNFEPSVFTQFRQMGFWIENVNLRAHDQIPGAHTLRTIDPKGGCFPIAVAENETGFL